MRTRIVMVFVQVIRMLPRVSNVDYKEAELFADATAEQMASNRTNTERRRDLVQAFGNRKSQRDSRAKQRLSALVQGVEGGVVCL